MNKKVNTKGFTLTEILIVLVVAGILLALILPNTLKAIERGNVTAHESNLNTIQVAAFMCYTKEKDWSKCSTMAQLTSATEQYLTASPTSTFGSYELEKAAVGTGNVACMQTGHTLPTGTKRCSNGQP